MELGSTLNSKWKLIRRLGEGAFGVVYEVTDGKSLYAMKVARVMQSRKKKGKEEMTTDARLLHHENQVYTNYLFNIRGILRPPLDRGYAPNIMGWAYMVLPKLGKTLRQHLDDSSGAIAPENICRIAIQVSGRHCD